MEIILRNTTGEFVLNKASSQVENKIKKAKPGGLVGKDARRTNNRVGKIHTPKPLFTFSASRISNSSSSLSNHAGGRDDGGRNAIILIAPRMSRKRMERLMRHQSATRNETVVSGFNNNSNKNKNKNKNDTSFLLSKKTIIVISPLLNVRRNSIHASNTTDTVKTAAHNNDTAPIDNNTTSLNNDTASTITSHDASSTTNITNPSPDDRSGIAQSITNSTINSLDELSSKILPNVFNMSSITPSASTSLSAESQGSDVTVTSSGSHVLGGNGTGIADMTDAGSLLGNYSNMASRRNESAVPSLDGVVGQVCLSIEIIPLLHTLTHTHTHTHTHHTHSVKNLNTVRN